MTNYANRGMSLESFVEYANQRYRNDGIAVVEKQHTKVIPLWDKRKKRIMNCKVEEKATVDFIGRYRCIPVAIEAKHTSTDRISFNEIKEHQAKFLDDFIGDYGLGFGAVLVSFKLERFFLVPWQFWAMGRDLWNSKDNKGKREIVNAYGMRWETTGKASVSADELNPEWEVKLNNKYGLAYLSKIDTYVQPHLSMKG